MSKIAQLVYMLVYDSFEENDIGAPITFVITIAVSAAIVRWCFL